MSTTSIAFFYLVLVVPTLCDAVHTPAHLVLGTPTSPAGDANLTLLPRAGAIARVLTLTLIGQVLSLEFFMGELRPRCVVLTNSSNSGGDGAVVEVYPAIYCGQGDTTACPVNAFCDKAPACMHAPTTRTPACTHPTHSCLPTCIRPPTANAYCTQGFR